MTEGVVSNSGHSEARCRKDASISMTAGEGPSLLFSSPNSFDSMASLPKKDEREGEDSPTAVVVDNDGVGEEGEMGWSGRTSLSEPSWTPNGMGVHTL